MRVLAFALHGFIIWQKVAVIRTPHVATLALLGALASAPLVAQPYPSRVVRMVVPFPPGGPTDTVARIYAGKFSEAWGQQVIIDNRGGANTIVAAELVARAPADGYTLFQPAATTLVNNTLVYRKLPYDAQKSFALISMTTINPYILATHPSLPAQTVQAFVALVRKRPGELSYASSGAGSSGHLAGVLFDAMTGTRMVHVPYKGAAAANIDVVSGLVPVYFTTMASVRPLLAQNKIKVLGFARSQRHPAWPALPTIAEAGYPNYEMNTWYGFAAPAGTPRAIIDRVHAETVRVAAMPDLIKRMQALDVDIITNTPEEFAAYVTRDIERVAKAVNTASIRLD
jgi:tripartite-type tricarboxylate transporter receptor subunit TctC